MKVQCTLIISTFRGMAAASPWITTRSKSLGQTQPTTFHSISAFDPINPNTFAYSTSAFERVIGFAKRVLKGSSEYNNNDEDENVRKTVLSDTAKGNSEHGHDERSRAFPKLSRPRPENVPWPAFPKSANKVDFTGMIGRPVEFNFTLSGQASARTSLAVITGPEDEPMWLHLLFWNELAEAAAEHLNKYDIVHVSGLLTSQVLAVEGAQQRIFYQVTPWRWDLVQNEAPTFSQQLDVKRNSPSQAASQHTVVNENTWSPVFFQLTFINRVPPFQY